MILRKPDKTKVNKGRANVHYCGQKEQQSTQRQSTSHERKSEHLSPNNKSQATKIPGRIATQNKEKVFNGGQSIFFGFKQPINGSKWD